MSPRLHVLLVLCLSFQDLFTCCTCSNTCHMLLVLCLSFQDLFTCSTCSNTCLHCASRFTLFPRVSLSLTLAICSAFCACRFKASSCVSHARLAALCTLSVSLLSISLLRSFCCGFARNTWPQWQANLRVCSTALHWGHTFLRRIDIPDPTDWLCDRLLSESCGLKVTRMSRVQRSTALVSVCANT